MTSESMKSRKKALQRQEILAAARDLFMNEGYAKMSMRKLAGTVGCVPGTLYHYFKAKHHFFYFLLAESF